MLSETPERWEIDLRGREVLLINIDYRVTLMLHGQSTHDGSVVLATPFELRFPGEAAIELDPTDHAALGPVLRCFKKTVESFVISRTDGSLVVTFTDGTTIESRPHDRFEAWEVNAADVQVIALPGSGEPALFGRK